MLGDLTGQANIDPQAIAAAIESLQAKGWDINPYTVADEAQIPRIALLRSRELMEILAKAKHSTEMTATETTRRLEELEERNRALEEHIAELAAENVCLLQGEQNTWQQGYQAGLSEGLSRLQDNCIDQTPALMPGCIEENGGGSVLLRTDLKDPDVASGVSLGQLHESYVAESGTADSTFEAMGNAVEPQSLPEGSEVGLEEYAEEWQSLGQDSQLDYEDEAEVHTSVEEPSLSSVETEVLAEFAHATSEFSAEELRDLLKYRFGRLPESSPAPKEVEAIKPLAGSKFVGGKRVTEEQPRREVVVRNVPPNVRKACLVLGLRSEELTREVVHKAWKKEMSNPGTHPDIGGETEIAVYINTARDTLYRWLDAQAPKLGKKFGTTTKETTRMPDKPANEDLKSEDNC